LSKGFRTFESQSQAQAEIIAPKKSRLELLQENVLALVLKNPETVNLINQDLWSAFSLKIQNLMSQIKQLIQSYEGSMDETELLKNFQDQDREFLKHLLFRLEVKGLKTGKEELLKGLKELERLLIKEKLADISFELKSAEENNDVPKVQELLNKFSRLSKKLN